MSRNASCPTRRTPLGGRRIGDISNNDWISFRPVNLSGIDTVSFRVSAPSNTGASIELRADSPTGALMREPVPVEYNASIEQMSGEDWSDVRMTLSTATPSLVARAPELHPYDVPELIALPVEAGLPAYCAWVATETKEAAV
jgi:hypothetical protein